MSGYQRIKVTRPGDGPLWIIEHPACEHEEIWRHWSDAISAAHVHARRCPALRLQRVLANLEAAAQRAEQHGRYNEAADMRALVARHRGEGE